MTLWNALVLAGLLSVLPAATHPARGQDAEGPPPPPEVAEAARLGRPMVIAPLCRLRDGTWASDLRQGLTARSKAPPGLTQGALGYAEAEALEDFAGGPPAATCTPLAASAELREADRIVAEWRARRPAT